MTKSLLLLPFSYNFRVLKFKTKRAAVRIVVNATFFDDKNFLCLKDHKNETCIVRVRVLFYEIKLHWPRWTG